MFVTLEGPEGSGKTSQGDALGTVLSAYVPILLTREPGGTELGERVRDTLLGFGGPALDPVTQLLLLSAARAQHVREVLRPAIAEGRSVLCVRYADSSRAYQGGGDGVAEAVIEAAIAIATDGLEPDLTIYLDLDPVVGLRRRAMAGMEGAQEGWNRFDARELAFHQRVRAAYKRLARACPGRVVTVDADRPFEAVRADILEIVLSRIAVIVRGGAS